MLKCSKSECTGCGVCEPTCPTNAISFVKNKEGFLYPKVDFSKCVDCDLCNKVCPALVKKVNNNHHINGFAIQLNDISLVKNTSSGGAFAGIAKMVLEKGGLVYGVANINNCLRYTRVENLNDLNIILGSKYYQCNIDKEKYKEIEKNSTDRIILVSGTPCQISALKNDIKINHDNILTFEILCQGVPSSKVVEIFNKEKEIKKGKKISNHIFRSKDKYVGRNYLNKYEYDDGEIEYYVGEEDPLSLSFQRQIFLRESCYKCKYTDEKRVADFTSGDLWNYNLSNKNINFKNGVSVLLCNNLKSQKFFDGCRYFEFEKIDYKQALTDNIPFHKSVKKPFCRNYSYFLLNKKIKPKTITYICCIKYYIKKLLLGDKK